MYAKYCFRYDCEKFGGQCRCKPNVIGRQCTRCKPGFFGFPDCKQCKCPPTATCDEETGNLSKLSVVLLIKNTLKSPVFGI